MYKLIIKIINYKLYTVNYRTSTTLVLMLNTSLVTSLLVSSSPRSCSARQTT